jgi:hypothetical protein
VFASGYFQSYNMGQFDNIHLFVDWSAIDMTTQLSKQVRNRLVSFLSGYLEDVNYRKALLSRAFIGTRATANLNTGGPSSQFTSLMVDHLQRFGFVDGGPALLRLLETFNEDIDHPEFNVIFAEVQRDITYATMQFRGEEGKTERSTSEEAKVPSSPPDRDPCPEDPQLDITRMTVAVIMIEVASYEAQPIHQQHTEFTAFMGLLQDIARQINPQSLDYINRVGDVIALTLFSTDHALDIALELAKQVEQLRATTYHVRIGLHVGKVLISTSDNQKQSVWGPGVQVAQRVMSFAVPGQILASEDFCRELGLLNNVPPPVIGLAVTLTGEYVTTPGKMLKIYNFELPGVGLSLREDYEAWIATFNRPIEGAVEDYKNLLEAYQTRREVRPDLDALKIAAVARRMRSLLSEVSADEVKQKKHIVNATIKQIRKATSGNGNIYFHYFLSNLGMALNYFFMVARLVRFRPGKMLFQEGHEPNVLLLIVAGQVRLSSRYATQDRFEGDGLIIGEVGLFMPDAVYQVSAHTLTEVVALAVRYEDLDGRGDPKHHGEILDIRRILWEKVYTQNVVREMLMAHELFRPLTTDEWAELTSSADFYPRGLDHNSPPTIESLARACLLVVSGEVCLTAKINSGGRFDIRYRPGEIIGMVHMAAYHFDDTHYLHHFDSLSWEQDTQLIILNWQQIQLLLDENTPFYHRCIDLYNETVTQKWHHLLDEIPHATTD